MGNLHLGYAAKIIMPKFLESNKIHLRLSFSSGHILLLDINILIFFAVTLHILKMHIYIIGKSIVRFDLPFSDFLRFKKQPPV
jgi:hypothetical protein